MGGERLKQFLVVIFTLIRISAHTVKRQRQTEIEREREREREQMYYSTRRRLLNKLFISV